MLSLCFVLQNFVSFLVLHFTSQGKKELVALLLLCSECHVLTLPHDAMSWSVVCACDIFWLYSLTF